MADVVLKDENQTTTFAKASLGKDMFSKLGFELRELSQDEKRRMRVSGVYVETIEVGSTIERTEMDPGYIITAVGEVRVSTIQEVTNELKKNVGQEVILRGFYENYPGEYYYTFRVK